MSDDGQRLYLCEVYLVEGEDAEHLRERAFLVWQREDKARLVGLFERSEEVGLHRC